jgi:hypothetical protein
MEQLNDANLYERPELVDLTETVFVPAAVQVTEIIVKI